MKRIARSSRSRRRVGPAEVEPLWVEAWPVGDKSRRPVKTYIFLDRLFIETPHGVRAVNFDWDSGGSGVKSTPYVSPRDHAWRIRSSSAARDNNSPDQ